MPAPASPVALIETHFGNLPDPRALHSIDHKLLDILIITICATISGANDFAAIAEYGREKEEWLKTFLELANGIPSVDTSLESICQTQARGIAKVLYRVDALLA